VAWLKQQSEDVLALRGAGILVSSFAWYSPAETIGWEHGLQVHDNNVREVRRCTLAGEIRPVGECYADLARRWGRTFDGEPRLQRRT
jgi:hypothetical protein